MGCLLSTKANFYFHIISIIIICTNFFQHFFNFTDQNHQNFKLNLFSVSFNLKTLANEDITTFAWIHSMKPSCNSDNLNFFSEICQILPSLQAGSYIFTFFSMLTILCCLKNMQDTYLFIAYKIKPKYTIFYFISPGTYLMSLMSLILLVKGNFNFSELHSELGIYIGIVTFILLMYYALNCYLFLIKEIKISVEASPEESVMRFAGDPNSNFSVSPKLNFEEIRFQQLEKSRLENKLSVNIIKSEEILIGNEGKSSSFLEIEGLLPEKNSENKMNLLENEYRNSELATCKGLIKNFKEMLYEKDVKYQSLERDLEVSKSISEALTRNNSILVQKIEDRERKIDKLHHKIRQVSGPELSENASKRGGHSSRDRLTEITLGGSINSDKESALASERIHSLSEALEYQKELNEQLMLKFKNLEETQAQSEKFKSKSIDPTISGQNSFFHSKNLSEMSFSVEKKFLTTKEKYKNLKNKEREYEESIRKYSQNFEEILKDRDRISEDLIVAREAIHSLQDQLSEVNLKFSQQMSEWDFERSDFMYIKKMLTRENEQLNAKFKVQEEALNQELFAFSQEIENLNDKLKLCNAELLSSKSESIKKSEIIKVLEQKVLTTSDPTSKEIKLNIEAFNELVSIKEISSQKNLHDLEVTFQEILAEKDELRKTISEKNRMIQDLSEECSKLNQKVYENEVNKRSRESMNSGVSSENNLNSMPSESSSGASYMSVQELLIVENLSEVDVKSNPLFQASIKLKKEPPMIYSNLWKLMETLMEEKYKVDKLDISLGRSPRSVIDFTNDFLILHFGLQSLAQKQLKSMISSLEELFRLGHPYGIFFCRLLSLFHARPIPSFLSVHLLLIQHLFNNISTSYKNKNFLQSYEILQYGGNISIIDSMELIMKVFKNHRKIGERIIFSLHRDSEKKSEIAMIKVCGTMAKTGKSPEYFFRLLDINDTNNLDYHEFVDGIRYTLGIWISQQEAEDVCSVIDQGSKGFLTMEDWLAKVDFFSFSKKIHEKETMVTKVQVLNAVIEEYELEIIEEYNKIRQIVKTKSLDFEEFQKKVKEIDENVKNHEISRLFQELQKSERTNNVSAEAFCVMIMKNKIGGYGTGIFGKIYVGLNEIKFPN